LIKNFFILKANKPIWHHVCITYDPYEGTRIYEDGMLKSNIPSFSITAWFKGVEVNGEKR
jgi:hypothetical protein